MPGLGFGPFSQRQGGNGMGVGRTSWFGDVLPPNAVIASHRVAWQSRRDGTGAVENVQEAVHASAGLPLRGFGPFLAMTKG